MRKLMAAAAILAALLVASAGSASAMTYDRPQATADMTYD